MSLESGQTPADPLLPGKSPTQKPRRRLRRWLFGVVVFTILSLLAGELVLRFGFGLGDPPLYELDDQVEYQLVPSRTYHRFGNLYSVNSFSMRSPEFAPVKKEPRELRVMVIGDSIVNGGARIDQRDLATEYLRERLATELQRPVVVGNISAGSWGPPNQLAYVERLGVFNADVVLLVYNSADAADVPGLEGIGPQWPQHTPALALQDAAMNYGIRRLERITRMQLTPPPARAAHPDADRAECSAAVKRMISLIRENDAIPVIIEYFTRPELEVTPTKSQHNFETFEEIARELNVLQFDNRADFRPLLSAGPDPFLSGDTVHASPAGQKALAMTFARAVHAALESPAQTEQPQSVPVTAPAQTP